MSLEKNEILHIQELQNNEGNEEAQHESEMIANRLSQQVALIEAQRSEEIAYQRILISQSVEEEKAALQEEKDHSQDEVVEVKAVALQEKRALEKELLASQIEARDAKETLSQKQAAFVREQIASREQQEKNSVVLREALVESERSFERLQEDLKHAQASEGQTLDLAQQLEASKARVVELEHLEKDLSSLQEEHDALVEEHSNLQQEHKQLQEDSKNFQSHNFVSDVQQKLAASEEQLMEKEHEMQEMSGRVTSILDSIDAFDREAVDDLSKSASRSIMSLFRRKSVAQEVSGAVVPLSAAVDTLSERAQGFIENQKTHERIMQEKANEALALREQLDGQQERYRADISAKLEEQTNELAEARTGFSKLLHKTADKKNLRMRDIVSTLADEQNLNKELHASREQALRQIDDLQAQVSAAADNEVAAAAELVSLNDGNKEKLDEAKQLRAAVRAALRESGRIQRSEDGGFSFAQTAVEAVELKNLKPAELRQRLVDATSKNGEQIQAMIGLIETHKASDQAEADSLEQIQEAKEAQEEAENKSLAAELEVEGLNNTVSELQDSLSAQEDKLSAMKAALSEIMSAMTAKDESFDALSFGEDGSLEFDLEKFEAAL
jgi:hypothetical protein